MKNKPLFYATILALTTAVISGAANFLNKFAVTAVKNPIFFTTLKNGLVAVFLIGVILATRKWREIIRLKKNQWAKLLAIGVIGGSAPFALYFIGLSQIPAVNAALIHKTLFLWVLLFAVPFLNERMSRMQWVGVLAIFAANVMVGGFQGFQFSRGELLVLIATILWGAENIIAKFALKEISVSIVAGARMVFGTLLLIPLVLWQGQGSGSLGGLSASQWGWIGFVGVLLAGYVLTWYSALKHAPATYVATLLVPATLVTNVLSAVFITHALSGQQLASAVLFGAGTAIIILFGRDIASAVNPGDASASSTIGKTGTAGETGGIRSDAFSLSGVLRCSHYSFGPNRLHYCGPDANAEILAYINNESADPGLEVLLKNFRTLYPYLKFIARANNIADPFDDRVVEAYWIGNELLQNVSKQELYSHLIDEQEIKKRLGSRDFRMLEDKIARRAVPHHSFHVLNIWMRTGHIERAHTLESMDACRVSWGKVLRVDGPNIIVETEPLVYKNGKLFLGSPVQKKLTRRLESEHDIEQLKPGTIVSIHWDVPCEVITERQAAALKKYTLRSLELANLTI